MAPRYQAKGDQTLITTLLSALTVGANATTAQRNYIYEYLIGIALTPSDSQITHTLQRCSALGTSSAVTPGLVDPGDRVAQAAVGKNHTVEPTYTANAFAGGEAIPINARATYRWVAPPNAGLTHAATVGAGIGWQALHATRTEDWSVNAWWEE